MPGWGFLIPEATMSEKPNLTTKTDIAAAIALGRALIAEGATKHQASEAIYDNIAGADGTA